MYVDSSPIFQLLLAFVVLLNIVNSLLWWSMDFFVGEKHRYRIYLLSYLPAPK